MSLGREWEPAAILVGGFPEACPVGVAVVALQALASHGGVPQDEAWSLPFVAHRKA